jgi:hypothetical protein
MTPGWRTPDGWCSGGVEFLWEDWAAVLGHRLGWRRHLNAELQIPAGFPLPTANFLGNRNDGVDPSRDPDWNTGHRKIIWRRRAEVLEARW